MKSWKNIKLRQAQELLNLGEMDNNLDLAINQMAIIRDTTIEEIEKLTPKELIDFMKEYSFLNETPKAKLTKTFKVGRKRFGMMEFNELTLAQVVDIEEYYADNFNMNIHKIMSCLYLEVKSYNPFTKKYTLEDYKPSKEREDVFLEMDMEFIWENILFFYHIEQTYLKGMKDYLAQMKKKMKKVKQKVEELR